METLAGVWAQDPQDLQNHQDLPDLQAPLDPRVLVEEVSDVWESQCVYSRFAPPAPAPPAPPAAPPAVMWTEQLSPHLYRNKQLQDTLLQREEELSRLQEENLRLRKFLSSSFVRRLQLRAKQDACSSLAPPSGRMALKRNRLQPHGPGPSKSCSKKVCRNLMAQFSSLESPESSPESPPAPEPNLDLWVLQTLGLKDRDTIDTSPTSSTSYFYSSSSSTSSPSCFYSSSSFSSVYGTELSGDSSFTSSSPPPGHSSTRQTSPAGSPEPPQTQIRSLVQSCDSPGSGLGVYGNLCPRQTRPPLSGSPQEPDPTSWCPLSPPQDQTPFSPPGASIHFCPTSTSSPVPSPGPAGFGSGSRVRTELAFSMSLSTSSSVKTHSFPQGQAFVRRDLQGWDFTWVPRQGP